MKESLRRLFLPDPPPIGKDVCAGNDERDTAQADVKRETEALHARVDALMRMRRIRQRRPSDD